jgi:hypothetical protein
MPTQTLVKTGEINVDGRAYAINYFEVTTPRGTRRYSSELVLGPAIASLSMAARWSSGVASSAADAGHGVQPDAGTESTLPEPPP